MHYRKLGATGLNVSEICLGSWLTYGNATENEMAQACIDKAYELGINFYDTSNNYANGSAETTVGAALKKYPRDSYVLATKVFFPINEGPHAQQSRPVPQAHHRAVRRQSETAWNGLY